MNEDLPKIPNWDELMRQQSRMPIYPSTPDYLGRARKDDYLDAAATSLSQMQADMLSRHKVKIREKNHVEAFKQTYIKLRTDNIILDHNTAIELAKMIYAEADSITYGDTQ